MSLYVILVSNVPNVFFPNDYRFQQPLLFQGKAENIEAGQLPGECRSVTEELEVGRKRLNRVIHDKREAVQHDAFSPSPGPPVLIEFVRFCIPSVSRAVSGNVGLYIPLFLHKY